MKDKAGRIVRISKIYIERTLAFLTDYAKIAPQI